MKTLLPTASRKRLEELLEYLGKTENYSEHYKGNRTEDFKKCFDIESPWCWKYADIVLRGLEKRPAKPGDEGHHAVPRSFYGVKSNCRKIDAGNLFTLSYAEHVWVHYCACFCATGKMRDNMVMAFLIMYGIGIRNKHALMPSEAELLDAIPEMEIKRIRAMEPHWAKVEAEGRTHYTEDPKQYYKAYREVNKEKIAERHKAYYEANKEKLTELQKARREANKEKIAEMQKAYYEANKDKCAEQRKAYYEANKDKIAEQKKAWREANKEKIAEHKKAYREVNKEKIAEQKKAWREANKGKIAEHHKAWREANREKLVERGKDYREANKGKIAAYREANKEKIAAYDKAYYETNKDKLAEMMKAYYEANREKIAEQRKAYREAKKAAGYRRRRDPVTGKEVWVFVGKPATPETPKSSTTAA